MYNEDILTFGEFLNKTLAKKNISISELMSNTGEKNRTAIYRLLQDESGMEQILKFKNTIIDLKAIPLSEPDKAEMEQAINVNKFGKEVIKGRKRLMELLLSSKNPIENNTKISVSSYGLYKDIRFLNDVFEVIKEICNKKLEPKIEIEILLLNSSYASITSQIADFIINPAIRDNTNIKIEHIVQFAKERVKNIDILDGIFKLLCHKSYKIFYDADYMIENLDKAMLEEFIVIKVCHCEIETMTFLLKISNDFSIMLYSENGDNLFNFYYDYFDNIKYKSVSFAQEFISENQLYNLVTISNYFEKFETEKPLYDLKCDPCYTAMDISIIDTVTQDFINTYITKEDELEQAQLLKKGLLDSLNRRKALRRNKKEKSIIIFSPNGLKNFAKTGILSDHIYGLRPFTTAERKTILKDLMQEEKQEKDNYGFCILKKDFFNDKFEFFYIKDTLIDFNIFKDKYKEDYKITIVNSKIVLEILTDLFENEILTNLVMPKDEANIFMQSVIDSIPEE